jgi:hypothetical protein
MTIDRPPPPRYAPHRPLPARAFIPGVSPSSDRPEIHTPRYPALPADLAADDGFRYGLDLYNHGFPWEAHEAWEAIWRDAPRDAPERLFVQALIQAAAAQVKALAGQHGGARKLAESAADLLIAAGDHAGIDAVALAAALTIWSQHAEHGAPAPRIALP